MQAESHKTRLFAVPAFRKMTMLANMLFVTACRVPEMPVSKAQVGATAHYPQEHTTHCDIATLTHNYYTAFVVYPKKEIDPLYAYRCYR